MNTNTLSREWQTVNLDGEHLIGDSAYMHEWVLDINTHGYTYQYAKVIVTLDGSGDKTHEISVGPGQLVRVCLKGYKLQLFGSGTLKYAFP